MATSMTMGPLCLDVTAESPWDAAVVAALAGFTPGDPGRPSALRMTVALRAGPLPSGSRALPRLHPSHDDASALVDVSSSWDARMTLPPHTLAASFVMRLRRTEPHVRRELALAALRVSLATAAPLADALLVHGASLARDDGGSDAGALVFVGPSGEGKTTMTRRLPGWRVLADDASLLTPTHVAGTPLRGKEGHARDGHAAPLRGVVILQKGADAASITRLGAAEAMTALLPRVFWYASAPVLEARLMDVLTTLVARVPCWRLASSLAHDVAPLCRSILEVES